jgi:hypothetical protein
MVLPGQTTLPFAFTLKQQKHKQILHDAVSWNVMKIDL